MHVEVHGWYTRRKKRIEMAQTMAWTMAVGDSVMVGKGKGNGGWNNVWEGTDGGIMVTADMCRICTRPTTLPLSTVYWGEGRALAEDCSKPNADASDMQHMDIKSTSLLCQVPACLGRLGRWCWRLDNGR